MIPQRRRRKSIRIELPIGNNSGENSMPSATNSMSRALVGMHKVDTEKSLTAMRVPRARRFSVAVSEASRRSSVASITEVTMQMDRADSRRRIAKLPKPLSVHGVLKFGDVVCMADLEQGGMLGCRSLILDSVHVDAHIDFDPSLSVHMQEEICFVIVQKFQFSAVKSFEKLMMMSDVAGINASNWKTKVRANSAIDKDMRRLCNMIRIEQDTNEMETKRMLGEPVAYGTVLQLRHRRSKKFVTQTKNRAEHDESAMEVSLMMGGMEGSWWKILPADKLRSEGEWVQYSDRIKLENVKHRNSFLTVSAMNKIAQNVDPDRLSRIASASNYDDRDCTLLHPTIQVRHEVNASPFISQFQVVPYQVSDASQRHTSVEKESIHRLHGLQVVTLCHRESEKLLVGDAPENCAKWFPKSLARSADGPVHPSALWKVQALYTELGGSFIPAQNSKVLLQHVQSGLYLSSQKGFALLTPMMYDTGCHWSLSALKQLSASSVNCISHGDLVWLTADDDSAANLHSWLSVDTDLPNLPQALPQPAGFSEHAGVASDALLRQGAWMDNDDLLELSLEQTVYCESVAFIAEAKALFQRLTQIISESTPIPSDLSVYQKVQMVHSHPVHDMLQRNYSVIVKSLDNLICTCTLSTSTDTDPFTCSGPPNKESQDLLRQMDFLETTISLVRSLFQDLRVPLSPVAKIPAVFQVVRRCYLLIERACQNNFENKKLMLRHVPMIQEHLNVKVGAYFTMMVIYSDTRELLEEVDEDQFREIVAGLKNYKSELWARFLVQTCHEGEQPIRKNQNLLTQVLLIEAPELIFRTTIQDNDVLLTSDSEDMSSFSVLKLMSQGEDNLFEFEQDDIQPVHGPVCQFPSELFRYHVNMLELLGWLVLGRNPTASSILRKNAARFGLEYEQLSTIMTNPDMPYTFRTRCCELIKRLYIDQDPHDALQVLSCTRIWTDLFDEQESEERHDEKRKLSGWAGKTGSDNLTATESGSSSIGDPDFEKLKIGVCSMIKLNERINLEHIRQNIFLNTLVGLVHVLTKFGFYHVYDTANRNFELRFRDVRKIATVLMYAIDGRSDVSDPGDSSTDLFSNAKTCNDILTSPDALHLMRGKIKMLDQLETFDRCCDNERITEFLKFWGKMLKQYSSGPQPGGDWQDASLTTLAWRHNPPWTAADIKSLSEKLFSDEYSILPRSREVKHLPEQSSPSFLARSKSTTSAILGLSKQPRKQNIKTVESDEDDWTIILLYLVRYPSHDLKERAFKSLIARFRQQTDFVNAALNIQIVYTISLADLFVSIEDDLRLLRNQVRYILGADSDTSPKKTEATKQWIQILSEWTELCTVTLYVPPENVRDIQRILANLGAIDVVTSVLYLSLKRISALAEPGQLDTLADTELRDLFNAIYAFIAKFCDGNADNQKMLIVWMEVFCLHLGIEGLKVEEALAALVKDNEELVMEMGKKWIHMFFEDLMVKYRCQRPEWLRVLHAVIRVGKKAVKEHQALTMVLFRRYETITALFMKDPVEWDLRIDLMLRYDKENPDCSEEVAMLDYSLAVITLLSVCCEGKNPAAEVYAARYLSIEQTIAAVVKHNVRVNGEIVKVPFSISTKLKCVHLTFLHDVYSQTNVTRLLEELHKRDNGIWAYGTKGGKEVMSLMTQLYHDLNIFVVNVRRSVGLHRGDAKDIPFLSSSDLESMREYIFTSVFRFLTFYFKARYSFVRGSTSNDEEITNQIHAIIKEFYEMDPPLEHSAVMIEGAVVHGRQAAQELLRIMSAKFRIGSEGRKNSVFMSLALGDQPLRAPIVNNITLASAQTGYRALCDALAAHYGISEAEVVSKHGIQQFSMMFSYGENEVVFSKNAVNPRGPIVATYDQLLMDIMELCDYQHTSPYILKEVLRLVRGTMYLCQPHGPEKMSQKAADRHWKCFLNDDPMQKDYGVNDEILKWVQHKYDAMGSTVAGLQLCSHNSAEVRLSSLRLLLTLLQTGNERVQQAVFDYFVSTKDTRFFKVAHDTVVNIMDTLKDFKKAMKQLKASMNNVDGGKFMRLAGTKQRPSKRERTEVLRVSAEFGRDSEVMLSLRLMQLMCEGQFRPLQDMMQKQTVETASYDLVRKCIDLFEAIQPLLYDSLHFNTVELSVLCMQTVDTISEMVQGPNLQNQKYLLSSKFLAVVNRILSTLIYSPVQESQFEEPETETSINDLRCWLKTSVVNCCLAILEGVGDEKRSARALEFFELRNFDAQMVSIGRLLNMVETPTAVATFQPWVSMLSTFHMRKEPSKRNSLSPPMKGSTAQRCNSIRRNSLTLRATPQHVLPPQQQLPANQEAYEKSMHFSKGWKSALESELFNMYFLLVVMGEHDESGVIEEWLASAEREHPKLFQHIVSHSSHVELARGSDNDGDMIVEKVYFRIEPMIMELTSKPDFKARTDRFIFDVPRENPQEKAKLFLKKSKQVLLTVSMLHDLAVSDSLGAQQFFFQRRDQIESTARRLAAVITILLLFVYGIPVDPNSGEVLGEGKFYTEGHPEPWYKDKDYEFASRTSDPTGIGATTARIMDYTDLALQFRVSLLNRWESQAEWKAFPFARKIMLLLAFLQVCVTLLSSFINLTLDFPLLYRECMERQQGTDGIGDEHTDTEDRVWKSKELRGKTRGVALKKRIEPMPLLRTIQSDMMFLGQLRNLLVRSVKNFSYLLLKLCISILGFYSSPFFFVFYLLDYFRSSIGHMVLKAIIVGGPNLARSFMLSMIVIVCFGFNSYAFFSQSINVNQQLCHSPFQCVLKHVLDSLTGDLSTVIGDDNGNFAFPSVAPWGDMWHTWRYSTVFLSLVLWVFLLLGIMQGQIIDSFAEMRDQVNAANDDLSNKCFISSIDKHSFGQIPGEWEKRKDGKFAWNYLQYFCYLQLKDPEEYSGLENTVSSKYAAGSIDFLPIERFYSGQHDAQDSENNAKSMMEGHVRRTKEQIMAQEKALADLKGQQDENARMMRDFQQSLSAHGSRLVAFFENAGSDSSYSRSRRGSVSSRSHGTSHMGAAEGKPRRTSITDLVKATNRLADSPQHRTGSDCVETPLSDRKSPGRTSPGIAARMAGAKPARRNSLNNQNDAGKATHRRSSITKTKVSHDLLPPPTPERKPARRRSISIELRSPVEGYAPTTEWNTPNRCFYSGDTQDSEAWSKLHTLLDPPDVSPGIVAGGASGGTAGHTENRVDGNQGAGAVGASRNAVVDESPSARSTASRASSVASRIWMPEHEAEDLRAASAPQKEEVYYEF